MEEFPMDKYPGEEGGVSSYVELGGSGSINGNRTANKSRWLSWFFETQGGTEDEFGITAPAVTTPRWQFWLLVIVAIILVIIIVIVTVVVAVKLSAKGGGGTKSDKVQNVALVEMRDPNLNRNAYAFSWTAPKKKPDSGTYYYQYTIYDESGNVFGKAANCTSNTFAMIQPYEQVQIGKIYSIDIYSSDQSDCSSYKKDSLVSFSATYPNIALKPDFNWDIRQESATTCNMWMHVVPTHFFNMMGSYLVTVVNKSNGQPVRIGQITYWNVNMFPNTANLQYSLPFNYSTSGDLLIQISATDNVGTTIKNNLPCPFPSTLPAPGSDICDG